MWASLQKTDIYYYRWSEPGEAKTRKQRRENTCRPRSAWNAMFKPTKITPTTETLLDVILTNKPNLFRTGGSFNPEISDHHLSYGILKQSVSQHRRKTIAFRSLKTWIRISLMRTWEMLPGMLKKHSMPSRTNMTHRQRNIGQDGGRACAFRP